MTRKATEQLVNETLGRIADKWTLLVIDALWDGGRLRFSQLMQAVPGVSQKMLTKTVRELERDGLLVRTVYAEVPPRVEYQLTKLGKSLGEAVCSIWLWAEKNALEVERCRAAYESGHAKRKA
jgi:DNA-binding HxlR family transcriptional regulator